MTSSKTASETVTRPVVTFIVWTLTSFLCHRCARLFIETADPSTHHVSIRAVLAVVVTCAQIATCFLCTELESKGNFFNMARVCHAMATLATNTSLAVMYASSAMAIKLMEPITSAVVQYAMVGTPLSPIAIISLPIIVVGAIGFTGNPFSATHTLLGVTSAFASNVILAFRNVSLKELRHQGEGNVKVKMSQASVKVILIFGCLAALVLIYLTQTRYVSLNFLYAILFLTMTSVFHVAYSYVSTGHVLKELSVVSHAVANILKRVLVVLLLYMSGSRVAFYTNWLALMTCLAGLALYTWDKLKSQSTKSTSSDIKAPVPHTTSWSKYAAYLLLFVCGCSTIAITIIPNSQTLLVQRLNRVQSQFSEIRQRFESHFNPDREDGQFSMWQGGNDNWIYSQSFGPNNFKLPTEEQLRPDLSGFSEKEKNEINEFLQKRLINTPEKASFLSQKLTTHTAVIKEAQRLHFNILGDALKKYKYSVLIDIATYENKGDPLIAVGEFLFLARINLPVIYTCSAMGCTGETQLKKLKAALSEYKKNEVVLLLQGGGNIIGYSAFDITRFTFLDNFPEYDMFLFPESIFMPDKSSPHVKKCHEYYCCNPKLTMVFRDLLSYQMAKELFSGTTKLIMAPDMAFQVGHVPRVSVPVFDVMWIKRGDSESPKYSGIPEHPNHLRYHVSDWLLNWTSPESPISVERVLYVAVNGFHFIQRGRVVVTDRLHGHIMAVLMNIPHVIIDNPYKKLSSYHNTWTRSLQNTILTFDPAQGVNLSISLLEKYEKEIPPRIRLPRFSESFAKYDFRALETSYT